MIDMMGIEEHLREALEKIEALDAEIRDLRAENTTQTQKRKRDLSAMSSALGQLSWYDENDEHRTPDAMAVFLADRARHDRNVLTKLGAAFTEQARMLKTSTDAGLEALAYKAQLSFELDKFQKIASRGAYRADCLSVDLREANALIENTISEWEALPGGQNHGVREVERWLLTNMQSAINKLRAFLTTSREKANE